MIRLMAAVLLGLAALAGCGSGEQEAQGRDLAAQACTYPVPEVPSPFDPETTPLATVEELAVVARARARLAEQAAAADPAWQGLSDAATAIAVYAELLRGIRQAGQDVATEMPREVWDQVKFASNAFLAECRPVT
jgi:hypothetical protein